MNILLTKNIYTFLLLLAGILFVGSCKPKKDPEPQIPCEQLADFRMYEESKYQDINSKTNDTWYSTFVENDTVVMAQGVSDHRVFFEAKQEGADKYEWWIGNETTSRVGKKISVLFLYDNIPDNITIPIKLKVTRQDRKECNIDGVYTTTKTITILRPEKAPFIGKYVAYDENNQPKVIEIYTDRYYNDLAMPIYYRIKNLVGIGTCNIILRNTLKYGTAFSFAFDYADSVNPAYNCLAKRGTGYLEVGNRNKLILQYTVANYPIFPQQIKNIIAYRIP